MRSLVLFVGLLVNSLLGWAPLCAQDLPDAADFTAGQVEIAGHHYPYRLLQPLPDQRGALQPLIVFLHGSGERGDDNLQQLRWLPRLMVEPAMRATRPCYLLAVQCPAGEQWTGKALRAVDAAIDEVLLRPGIDAARVYLTGLSMGGFGAFELATREPDRFAAVLAICGGGDAKTVPALLGLPLQIWHGSADPSVPVERSRQMVAALQACGGAADYHELPGMGHNVWSFAYGEGRGIDWLLAQDQRQQRRGAAALPAIVPLCDIDLYGGRFTVGRGARCIADDAAQAAARLWLDAWHGDVARPGLIASGEPRAGDFVFGIDAALPVEWELTIERLVTVKGRDAHALSRAAAALDQALSTWPGGACPTARCVRPLPTPAARVVFGASAEPWTVPLVQAALREAWWFGADELSFAGAMRPAGLDDEAWSKLDVEAKRRGLTFVDGNTPLPSATTIVGATVRELMATKRANPPTAFVLQLAPAAPEAALTAMRWQLPAAAEWAQRPAGPVHLAGFYSRLGALRR